jgi:2-methylisocitrate lyase-like PEP mutase family enzyme
MASIGRPAATPGWDLSEGGYGLAPDDLVEALLEAGAVGCNIEDTDYTTGDRLLDADAQAGYLAGIRDAADYVYPMTLRDPALVAEVVSELGRPVNVNPSESLAALAEAGAARISLGGGVHRWMMAELERRARRLLAGDATAFE